MYMTITMIYAFLAFTGRAVYLVGFTLLGWLDCPRDPSHEGEK